MKSSDFIFDCVHLFCCKCYKINFKRGRFYIDSIDWIKNKKATINPINKNGNKYLQCAATIALSYEIIGKNSKRIAKIERFIYKYIWEGIKYPSEKYDWKKFEKNNLATALNILYAKNKKTYLAFVSKHN